MYEIRVHGLGGEGVVRLSKMIGKAATKCCKWAHSFPFFGTDVRGGEVKAFTRIDDAPINIKSYIYEPDVVIVTNDILLENRETTEGLKEGGYLLVNSVKKSAQLGEKADYKIIAINATDLAFKIIGKSIVNTILFGAFIGISDLLPLNVAAEIISEEFADKIAKLNISALEAGYGKVKEVV